MQQSPLEPYFVPNFHMMKKSLIKKTTNQHCSNVRRVLIVCVRSHWLHGQDLFKTLQLKSGFEASHGQNLLKNLKTIFGFTLSVVKPLKTPNTAGIFQFMARHSNLYGGSDETHPPIEHSAQTHCRSCFPISSFA